MSKLKWTVCKICFGGIYLFRLEVVLKVIHIQYTTHTGELYKFQSCPSFLTSLSSDRYPARHNILAKCLTAKHVVQSLMAESPHPCSLPEKKPHAYVFKIKSCKVIIISKRSQVPRFFPPLFYRYEPLADIYNAMLSAPLMTFPAHVVYQEDGQKRQDL